LIRFGFVMLFWGGCAPAIPHTHENCGSNFTARTNATLALVKTSESRKRKLVENLAQFYKYRNMPFDRPRYRKIDKVPFITLESEVDALISASGLHCVSISSMLASFLARVADQRFSTPRSH